MKQPRRLWQERIQRRAVGHVPADRPWLAFWPKDTAVPSPTRQDPSILLHYAALHGVAELVEELLKLGACPNQPFPSQARRWAGVTPLHLAAWSDHSSIAAMLLKGGAEFRLTTEGVSPLDIAVRRKHPKTLRAMVDAGAPAYSLLEAAHRQAELSRQDHSATLLLLAMHGLILA